VTTLAMTASPSTIDADAVASDESLAVSAASGDVRAFESLMRRHQQRVHRFARRHVFDAHEAEDLVQETFLRAHAALRRYDPTRRFTTWLLTIAYRLCVDASRRKSTRVSAGVLPDEIASSQLAIRDDEPGPLWQLARRELNDAQCAMLWMCYAEGLSVAEISTATGKSWVNVKVTLHRARKKLERAASTLVPSPGAPEEG
jgi:RNA polymerase sigma factor CnrH